MPTYIALTSLESHWGNPNNTVLLTDGCRLYDGGNSWENYGEPLDTERFHTPQNLDTAYDLCSDLSARAMPKLASLLDGYYGFGCDMRFYERIVWSWLFSFTQVLYDRYLSVHIAASLSSNVCFLTADVHGQPYPPKDSLGAVGTWTNDDAYNLLLYSDIITFLGLNQKKIALAPLSTHYPEFGNIPSCSRKDRILYTAGDLCRAARSAVLKSFQHLLSDCYGACINPADAFWGAKTRWQRINTHVRLQPLVPNMNLRKSVLSIGNTTFESLLGAFIPRYIPFGMCEALPDLVEWARKYCRSGFKGVLATSIGLYTDIPLMVMAGVSKRPLAVLEHGGNLMLRTNSHRDIQLKVATRYFSQGAATTAYLPSPYLSNIRPARCVSAPLLVANDGYRYLPRLMSVFCEGSSQPYHKQRKDFLRALPKHLYPELRLYPREFGWGVRKGLEAEFANLRFQDGSTMAIEQAIADSCLIVVDHYSTTFHCTMATNRPTILFSKADIFAVEAEPVIEAMRQCKIWHDTPGSAAKHYQSLVGNVNSWADAQMTINDWWLSSEVQAARKIFCDMYARTSDNWAQEWTDAFDKLTSDYC